MLLTSILEFPSLLLAKARFEIVFDCRNETELTPQVFPGGGEKRAISSYVMVGKAQPALAGGPPTRRATSGKVRLKTITVAAMLALVH
jgi:hypothetical protein